MEGVSLSFAAADAQAGNASAPKRRVHEEQKDDDRRNITTFQADSAGDKKPKKTRKVIPCKPNQLLVKPQDKADAVGKLEDRFQAAAKQQEASGEYGLIQRADGSAAADSVSTPQARAAPPAAKDRRHHSLQDLAEDPTEEGYGEMPVEDFGMALLRGMGMTAENTVEAVEYVARPARMGLGVDPSKIGVPYSAQRPLSHSGRRVNQPVLWR